MSDIQIGKFQVIERLGTGAHSTILHIRRQADSRNYALKVVTVDDPAEDMKYVRQVQHESRVGKMLDHKHLVKIYALEVLKDWLSLPRLAQVFQQASEGVVHMHRRGVFHSDLKPNNILLSRAGFVKIIDFGLAQIRGEKTERLQGTPEYMAPETASNGLVNERTDIFNFGVTMYRMVTFRLPPSTVTAEAGGLPLTPGTYKRLLKPVQQYNAAAPAGLCDLIHRCLSYESAKRPERMSDVQHELDFLVERLAPTPADRLESMEW
jgi:serine/threonine protein kinase